MSPLSDPAAPERPPAGGVPGVGLQGTARAGAAVLFQDLALELPAGRWTCLLGPSGVGKSTLLRLIAGLDAHVAFEGRIAASDGLPVAGRIAYMAQQDLLFPWLTVTDNVALGARLRGTAPDIDKARTMIEAVGLADHAAKKPAHLSGGQRQRAALARTLMEDRPIVLLDEPFSALDARTRSEMQDLAARLLTGRTVLLVTHDPGEAVRLGDRLAIMSPGGLQSLSPPEAPPPRAVDDPDTLALQGALLRRLREGD